MLDQFCSSTSSSEIQASSSNNHLADNALNVNLKSNIVTNNESYHISQLSQGLSFFKSCVHLSPILIFIIYRFVFFLQSYLLHLTNLTNLTHIIYLTYL